MKDFLDNYKLTKYSSSKNDSKVSPISKGDMSIQKIAFKRKNLEFLLAKFETQINSTFVGEEISMDPFTQFRFNYNKHYIYTKLFKEKKNKNLCSPNNSVLSGNQSEENYLIKMEKEFISPNKLKSINKKRKKPGRVDHKSNNVDVNTIDPTKIENILNGFEDLYEVYGINNYSNGVICYKIELDFYKILRQPVIENRRIGEITSFTDNDTVLSDENVNVEDEGDSVDQESIGGADRSKIEIKKSEILIRDHSSMTSSTILTLKWASLMFVLIHFAISLLSFILYTRELTTTENFISGYNYLNHHLNCTSSSANTLLDLLIISKLNFNNVDNKSGRIKLYYYYLNENTELFYQTNNLLNALPIFEQENYPEVSKLLLSNITFKAISYDASSTPYDKTISLFEGLIELMSTLYSLSLSQDFYLSFDSKDVQYFLRNTLNSALESLESANGNYKKIYLDLNNKLSQIIIMIISAVLYSALIYVIFVVLTETLDKMNIILIEFLGIKPQEAQVIVKRCEYFVKNIRVSNADDNEDEEKEEEVLKVTRNNKALKDKLKKSRTGYNFILFLLILLSVVLMLYYIILFLLVSNFKKNTEYFFNVFSRLQKNNLDFKLLSIETKLLNFNYDYLIYNKNAHESLLKRFDNVTTAVGDYDTVS
jgi:hypothetical protein